MSQSIGYLAFDIGARTHAWSYCINDKRRSGTIDNDPTKLKPFIEQCLKQAGQLRVLAEATGIYFLDSMLLAQQLGAEVMVINPRAAHHFAQAISQRNKTDKLDADMLLECLMRMPFKAWQPPRQAWLELRSYGRYLSQLTQDGTVARNRLHAYASTKATPTLLLRELKRKIVIIDNDIERIRAEVIELIRQDEYLLVRYDALNSITGIGSVSAISLLSELVGVPDSLSARACVSMAGLDPRVHESGTSVHKAPRISRHGNRYLRHALFMPALAAARHDQGANAFKQRLVEGRGKKKMQANVAIMRKMLTVAWAMMKNPQPYDSKKLYAEVKIA